MRSVPALAACIVALGIAAAIAPSGQAADVPRTGATMLDTISPTAPRGFAADLPRSPLADAIVNGGLRFASAAEARLHCPQDDVVRVDTFSNVYRPAGVPRSGAFMCKAAALQEGDRPR